MIKAVIFDMDGTIFDSERLLMRGWQGVVDCGMAPPALMDLIPLWRGKKRAEISRIILGLIGEDRSVEPLYQKRREIIYGILDAEGVPLKAGVPQVFEDLRRQGFRLALATASSEETVSDYMRRTGYQVYFDRMITGDRVSNGKPAPDIFLLAAEELGVSPSECIVVEDSPNGVRSGYHAGMRVIMVPDLDLPDEEISRLLWHRCETLSEIPPLVEKLNQAMSVKNL